MDIFFFLLLILHCSDLIFRFNLLHSLETDKFFIHSGFQGRISWCHFAETMVFSNGEKAVIKNDFLEIEWNAYKICKEHPTKSWNRVSVYILLKRFQEDNSMDRRAGSGRQRTITTEEKENLIENLICSQEENPGSRMSPREKGIKVVQTCEDNHDEVRKKDNKALADRFRKSRSIEKYLWLDEKGFTLDFPLNYQNSRVFGFENKDNIQDNRLFHHRNRLVKKVVVSACQT